MDCGTVPCISHLSPALTHTHTHTHTLAHTHWHSGWKEDKMHGKGTYKFATGDVYEGGFVDGMFSGYGAYRFPDGSLYEGEWKDNLMHGAGYYLDKFSRRFEGEFLFGSFNSAANYVSNAPPELNHAADTDLLIQQKLFGGDGGAGVGHDEAGAPALAAWAGGDATPGTIE